MRFLRRKDAAAKVGYSAVHIMRLAKVGKFPRPIILGEGGKAFLESEVEEWMEERLAERDRATEAA